jgi:hypothetical protein
MTTRTTAFAFFLALMGLEVWADVAEYELVQPVRNDSGVILHTKTGHARIETDSGILKRLPVRRDETLSSIAEIETGWVLTGTKDSISRREIVMIAVEGSGARRLAAPGGQSEPFRVRPAAVLGPGSELEGLAWLEGPDLRSLSVRFARRQPSEWSEVVEIAPATRGSQSGLTATAMSDRSWLLVWSAFDGNDDDLFFSRMIGDSVSRPARLTRNSVPDVMPSLVASDDGALLAWSQLEDGDYRVKVSRFDGVAWSAPRTHGLPGAQQAELSRQNNQLRLVYRQAWPREWIVSEISNSGRTERRANFSVSSNSRPVFTTSVGGTVQMRWPRVGSREAKWTPVP